MATSDEILTSLRHNRTSWSLRRQMSQTVNTVSVVQAQIAGITVFNQYTVFQAPLTSTLGDLKGHVIGSSTGVSIENGVATFDGTGGLAFNATSDFDLYMMPFGIEGWFKTSQTQQYTTLLERGSGGTVGDWELIVNNTVGGGELAAYEANNLASPVTGGHGLNDGARHHFAFVRSGSWFGLFGDGALLGFKSLTSYDVWPANTQPLYLGNSQTAGRHLIGTMDNVRILRGITPYTVPFTVPIPPFTTT